jgi:type III secretory pathway component EscT
MALRLAETERTVTSVMLLALCTWGMLEIFSAPHPYTHMTLKVDSAPTSLFLYTHIHHILAQRIAKSISALLW